MTATFIEISRKDTDEDGGLRYAIPYRISYTFPTLLGDRDESYQATLFATLRPGPDEDLSAQARVWIKHAEAPVYASIAEENIDVILYEIAPTTQGRISLAMARNLSSSAPLKMVAYCATGHPVWAQLGYSRCASCILNRIEPPESQPKP